MITRKGLIALLALISGSCFLSTIEASKSHPVTTFLNAKWFRSPPCLEIAEYLFDENPNLFWEYVEQLHQLEMPLHTIGRKSFFFFKYKFINNLYFQDTDSKRYKSAIRVAEDLLGATQTAMLKVSLAMHSQSPRVQAHFQIANEVIAHGDCKTSTFVTIGNKVACNLAELKSGITKALPKAVVKEDVAIEEAEEIYSFDHVYPGSENNSVVAVLYGELGSSEFKVFHEYLKGVASNGVKYIARHFVKVKSEVFL